jgi:hypothetical protein
MRLIQISLHLAERCRQEVLHQNLDISPTKIPTSDLSFVEEDRRCTNDKHGCKNHSIKPFLFSQNNSTTKGQRLGVLRLRDPIQIDQSYWDFSRRGGNFGRWLTRLGSSLYISIITYINISYGHSTWHSGRATWSVRAPKLLRLRGNVC